jgi:hypothetical protein
MFVPLGAPVEALPGFAQPPLHLIVPDLNIVSTSQFTKFQKSNNETINSTIPLDLRKSPGIGLSESPSHIDYNLLDRNSPKTLCRSSSENCQMPDANSLKKREIESQLQFFKAKQVGNTYLFSVID